MKTNYIVPLDDSDGPRLPVMGRQLRRFQFYRRMVGGKWGLTHGGWHWFGAKGWRRTGKFWEPLGNYDVQELYPNS